VSGVRSCCVPATPVALEHRLVRPEASQVHCRLQLGFAKADHLGSVASHKFVDHLLFRLGVETSDIEGEEFELLPVSSHFRESAIDVVSLTVRSCIRQVLSVVGLVPSRSLRLLFGPLGSTCGCCFVCCSFFLGVPVAAVFFGPSAVAVVAVVFSFPPLLSFCLSLCFFVGLGGVAVVAVVRSVLLLLLLCSSCSPASLVSVPQLFQVFSLPVHLLLLQLHSCRHFRPPNHLLLRLLESLAVFVVVLVVPHFVNDILSPVHSVLLVLVLLFVASVCTGCFFSFVSSVVSLIGTSLLSSLLCFGFKRPTGSLGGLGAETCGVAATGTLAVHSMDVTLDV
jgi:hypothetical protein